MTRTEKFRIRFVWGACAPSGVTLMLEMWLKAYPKILSWQIVKSGDPILVWVYAEVLEVYAK